MVGDQPLGDLLGECVPDVLVISQFLRSRAFKQPDAPQVSWIGARSAVVLLTTAETLTYLRVRKLEPTDIVKAIVSKKRGP